MSLENISLPKNQSRSRGLYEYLREAILTGIIKDNENLKEENIAKLAGVSKTPVRARTGARPVNWTLIVIRVTEVEIETPVRLHPRQSAKWYALHRRDRRCPVARHGAQRRARVGLHKEVRCHASCLVRIPRRFRFRDRAREETQSLETRLEDQLDRRDLSGLGGSI